MTPLTASGWLWAGWCVFALVAAIVDMFRDIGAIKRAEEMLVALLSIAWLAWLVAP